ncbi:MAG: circadian clock protein KaiB [Chthoniobacter sp.]|jgi:circadian clock protein KaiB|nr:circadian clock protein KaiB [Chthoniobacter sp.]
MSERAPARLPAPARNREYDLRLYVAGATANSSAALRNLEKLCEEHLAGRYHLEIIDLMKNPQFAQSDQILALPTLVRKEPAPVRKVVGNLSNAERVLAALNLRRPGADPFAGKETSHVG